jgi:Cu(I)/Ag(I) efflux system membrane fusion protein
MLNKISKIFLLAFAILFALTAFSFAQNMDSMKMEQNNMQGMHMKNDSANAMKMDTAKNTSDSIVREGVIDLKSIDENKNGKVYQDMMDYNVISDKPGTCPLCGMTLKEVSLKKAKEILIKSGFKVK